MEEKRKIKKENFEKEAENSFETITNFFLSFFLFSISLFGKKNKENINFEIFGDESV